MSNQSKKIQGVAGSAILLAGMGAGSVAALAPQADAAPASAPAAAEAVEGAAAAPMRADRVEGSFSFTQMVVTPTDEVARALNDGARYLCGSDFAGTEVSSTTEWSLTVRGAVGHGFSATLEELAEDGSFEMVMGCSCAGNPSDGTASVNADVAGVTVASLMLAADVDADANTIVFTSSDGYEVALPLSYVAQRASLIVYAVNGEDLCDSIGGANQLWLGSTSARYFVRNVETITFEVRDEAPPIPGTAAAGDTYANVPNISVAYGGQA